MDELNTYLINTYPEYITGRTDCNLLIWGTDENAEQLPKLCTLIVGVEYDPLECDKEQIGTLLDQKYASDVHFNDMYRFGSEIAKRSNVPYVVIGFPSLRMEFNNRWEQTKEIYPVESVKFFLHEFPSKGGSLLTGEELRTFIYGTLGKEYSDVGTTKAKNKSIADYFQFWSRSFLSRHLVKLDIDGMFFNGTDGLIIEIKRSNKPPIPDWRPYKKDYPDFSLLKSFSDSIGMDFVILHHTGMAPCDGNTIISLFEIEQFISVDVDMIYSRQELEMLLEADDGLNAYLNKYIAR
jgi:hypothetical protein